MPNLSQISQALARGLNDLLAVPTTGGTASTGGSDSTVVLPDLIVGAPHASNGLENGAWIYNVNSGFQARGQSGGYDPATGKVIVDPPWVAPVSGDIILLTQLFPMVAQVLTRDSGYDYLSNEAARWLWFEHQLAVPTVAGQHSYDLSAYRRWLNRREQLLGLLDPPLVAGYVPRPGDWRRPTLEFAGGSPTLRLPTAYRSSGETFLLGVRCPLIEFVNGANSDAGMGVDADGVQGDLAELVEVGLWIAYRTLATRQDTEAAAWAQMAKDQEARARALYHFFDRQASAPLAPAATTASPGPSPRTPALAGA